MEFSKEGGEGATPYEVLLHAALIGNGVRFTRQDGIEEAWRIMQPLLDSPPVVHPTRRARVAESSRRPSRGYGSWHDPGSRRRNDDGPLRRDRRGDRGRRRRWPGTWRRRQKILLLERGDWLRREPENWSSEAVFADNRCLARHLVRRARHGVQPQIHYFVGSATKLYGAALYRLRPEDFGDLQHHDGVSPAWPVSYDEMEPYTRRPSRCTRYTATAARTRPRATRARRIRSRRSRTSRASSSSRTHSRSTAITRSTRLRDPARRADPAFSHCVRCANCDGFPCLVHGKSDADVLGVRPALEHSNVTLLTNARL